MKQPSKNIIPIILMFSSLALLVVFQAFWLRQEYKKQTEWLKKEADAIFHVAMSELQDSIWQNKIFLKRDSFDTIPTTYLTPDTSTLLPRKPRASAFIFHDKSRDTAVSNLLEKNSKYNIMLRFNDTTGGHWQSHPKEKVSIATTLSMIPPDNIRAVNITKAMQQVILSVQKIDGEQEFIIEFDDDDTLNISTVRSAFATKLAAANISIAFEVQKIASKKERSVPDQFMIGPVTAGIPSQEFFAATLHHYNGYLFRKLIPQLLFSVFLLSMTAISFWLIYRNLRKQQRLTQLKNDFISNVTHELKTPIATVSVAIEALRDFDALRDPKRTEEYLEISKNELNRLSILVDKVLKMAIFEQKEPELRLETFNFSEMVTQIVASMKLQFEKYNATVSFQSIGEDLNLRGDRIHLTNVVYNLIDNALKYSKENPTIDIQLEGQNGQLHLSVQDNGIGIASEYKNRVFEKFFRVPTGDIHNTKGHGLGLSYVAKVIQKHGGVIDVESKAGIGSCFQIHLPRHEHAI